MNNRPEENGGEKLDGNTAAIRTPFTQWLENFWYHYKWQTIVALFTAITVIICAVQCSNSAKNDSLVLYAGAYDMTYPEAQAVKSAFEEVVGDYNDDDERDVELVNLFIMSPSEISDFNKAHRDEGVTVNTTLLSNNWETFQNEILSGEASVCIMSQYCFDYVKNADGFSDTYDWYYLSYTNFGKHFSAMKVFPEDTILCLRRISTMQSLFNKNRTEREYADQVDFYERIINFTPPEGLPSSEDK